MTVRAATVEECDRLLPAARAEHLVQTLEELREYRSEGPWRVRVNHRGDACVLGRWKAHLDVLAIRAMWCPERRVAELVRDAKAVARDREFGRLLSPLLPEVLLGPYRACGLTSTRNITAIQGLPEYVVAVDPPGGVSLRQGSTDDLAALALLDAQCFDEFWRWGEEDLRGFLGAERSPLPRRTRASSSAILWPP